MKTLGAIFLDRDGTLIVDKNYLSDPKGLEYYADTFPALKIMREKGYMLFMITNQSGVGRGFFAMAAVENVHQHMQQDFIDHGIGKLDGIAVCPHHPDDNCECRKPRPKMIADFIQQYHLSKDHCYMAGDKEIDAECGKNAGIHGVIVRYKSETHQYFQNLLQLANDLPQL